jgi:hypothetical protein
MRLPVRQQPINRLIKELPRKQNGRSGKQET